ncbi:MAG: Gar1/Naf1 family protein [Candidatus Bathyarchaeia archaeon]
MKNPKKPQILRAAGRVFTISKQGSIIVKLEGFVPRLGTKVYDKNLKPLGVVVDVIGNVKSPYMVVRPLESKESGKIVGDSLYVKD